MSKIIVMEVVSAEKHPNADSLRLYMFACGDEKIQIIANMDNVYEVGDKAYIAKEGSVLKDGTKIKATKIRSVDSFGMALGKATGETGIDVTAWFGILPSEGFSHIPWPSIESLFNIRRDLKALDQTPVVTYRAKIKLDGTNACIQIKNGTFVVQSRTAIISPQDDNVGFAAWVHKNCDGLIKSISAKFPEHTVSIFGEWAGSKIQKGTAISQIERKIFAVFAIQYDKDGVSVFDIEPYSIFNTILWSPRHRENSDNKDIFVLPWYGEPITLDYGDVAALQVSADKINEMVSIVENEDPWVKEVFGISGIGEGLVFYPVQDGESIRRSSCAEFLFKAKGEKHKVVKTAKPAQLEPEKVESINGFVQLFVTEARLEQGVVVACNGEYSAKHIGSFLKWFGNDVIKESVAELEASGLEWKQVSKQVSEAARNWYLKKTREIV